MLNPLALCCAILVGLVALLHVYFCVLEMFLWQRPRGLKTFRMTSEQAASTAVLAGNQGLYNLFLAVALIVGMARHEQTLVVYGLVCVAAAGFYGAATVNRRIFFVQALPALLALALGFASVAYE